MEQNERFDRIYAETRDDLLRYLMLRTSADPEAEDLFQEAYRSLYLRMTRSILPIRDSRRYLFSVAKKALFHYYRRKARQRALERTLADGADAADDRPIDERLLTEERKRAVWRLLQNEPELNRRIFVLFYGWERSQKEIAAALDLSEEAVRQRLYRTRNNIRRLLESDGQGKETL